MMKSIHSLFRNQTIPIQRAYRQLMGQDLITKKFEKGFLNNYEVVVSFIFSFYGIPLKYSEIEVSTLESNDDPYKIFSEYLRDHNCIVKHEYFDPSDSTLSNGQLLILFESSTNKPYVLINPNGFNLQIFDPDLCKSVSLNNLDDYQFNRDALNVSYTDTLNNQSIFDLLKFGSKHLGPSFLLLGLTLIISSILGLFYPIILSRLITTIIPQGLSSQLIPLSLLFIALTAGFILAQFASIYNFIFADALIDNRLQISVFKRLFEMPISFFQNYRSGDLMSRAQAISQIRSVLSGSFIDTLVHGSILLTSLIIMTIFSWKLTIFTLILSILYFISTLFFGYLEAGSKIGELRALGINIGYIFTTLKSFLQLKAEKREQLLSNHFGSLVYRQLKSTFRAEMYGQFADIIDIFLKSFGLFALFLLGHHLANTTDKNGISELNVGKFVAYISLYTTYVASLYKLTRSFAKNGSTILALWHRAKPIYGEMSERLPNEFPLLNNIYSIRFSNVNFSYPSQTQPLFNDLSFDIPKGSTVWVDGGISSGKTTLLNLLLGFDYVATGSVEINNIDIRSIDLFDLRTKFGVVPQSREILPGVLKDYLLNGAQFSESDVLNILEQLGALDEYKKYPLGLNTPVSYGGYNFPSNFREILLLTRSLLTKPEIFYADDSLLSSDKNIISRLRSIIGQDSIIILSSRRQELTAQCDLKIEL